MGPQVNSISSKEVSLEHQNDDDTAILAPGPRSSPGARVTRACFSMIFALFILVVGVVWFITSRGATINIAKPVDYTGPLPGTLTGGNVTYFTLGSMLYCSNDEDTCTIRDVEWVCLNAHFDGDVDPQVRRLGETYASRPLVNAELPVDGTVRVRIRDEVNSGITSSWTRFWTEGAWVLNGYYSATRDIDSNQKDQWFSVLVAADITLTAPIVDGTHTVEYELLAHTNLWYDLFGTYEVQFAIPLRSGSTFLSEQAVPTCSITFAYPFPSLSCTTTNVPLCQKTNSAYVCSLTRTGSALWTVYAVTAYSIDA